MTFDGNPIYVEPAPNAKHGTLSTTIGHIFCAVVGAGVLGLPNSLAWLGWIAGPILLLLFYMVSLWTSRMLADVYRVGNTEFARYHHAVRAILGERYAIIAACFQCAHLILATIAYTITGAIAMKTVATRINSSFGKQWEMTLILGVIELFLSQLPNMAEIWWVSAIGSACSLIYCFIALILGAVYAHNGLGSIQGRSASAASKAFNCLNSLGALAFAYSFAQVLLEIQDTLRQPPHANKTMKTAVNVAVTAAFGFYISVACTGYAALGSAVPGEVLEGFEDAPNWTIVVANIAIAVHMYSAFQVFAQPLFETIESWVKASRIKRHLRKARGAASTAIENTDADDFKPSLPGVAEAPSGSIPSGSIASPFDSAASGLVPLPEGAAISAAESGTLDTLGSAQRSGLGSRPLSVRLTASGIAVCNSAPIPTLLPPGGWQPSSVRLRRHSVAHEPAQKDGGTPAPESRLSTGPSRLLAAISHQRDAMYAVDTGFCDESVPLNEQGFYAPFYQRLVIRSSYVAFVTLISILMPFFSPVVGLVGSITYFPLCVLFPCLMWAKVYKPQGLYLRVMKGVCWSMLFVALGAIVGSVQALIDSWAHGFTLFD